MIKHCQDKNLIDENYYGDFNLEEMLVDKNLHLEKKGRAGKIFNKIMSPVHNKKLDNSLTKST